ncbi:MAG: DNA polymerase III subunit beta [Ruminiclostridium sp.]
MRFTCEAKELCGACAEAAKAVSVKSTIPALTGIRMILSGSTLSLSGYDMEIGVETKMTVVGEEDGAIVTNAANIFLATISKLKGEIEFTATENRISIRSKKGNIEFIGSPESDYPNLPEYEMKNELAGIDLKAALASTAYCIVETNSRVAITGALITARKGVCEIVGTNGSLIALFRLDSEVSDIRTIIPKRAMKIIGDCVGKRERIFFGATDNLASFGDDCTRIITRTISGNFLDYGKVIDRARNFNHITINRSEFAEIIELVNTVCTEKDRKAAIFHFGENGIDIKMETSLGRVENHIGCECPVNYTTAFNPRYLYDVVSHSGASTVDFYICGAEQPMMITDNNGYEAVVLPIKLK